MSTVQRLDDAQRLTAEVGGRLDGHASPDDPVIDELSARRVLSGLLMPAFIDGLIERQADPVLIAVDPGGPARLDRGVSGRDALGLPRLLAERGQPIKARAPTDAPSALVLPRVDRMAELDLDGVLSVLGWCLPGEC